MVKNNFSEPKNHQKLYISRSIYFLNKIPARRFVGLLCTNKLEIFFFEKKKNVFKDLELVSRLQNY